MSLNLESLNVKGWRKQGHLMHLLRELLYHLVDEAMETHYNLE